MPHFKRVCHRAAACVESDITRGSIRPLGVQCNARILIIRACAFTVAATVAFSACKSVIPAKENIALALGHRHVAELLAVGDVHSFRCCLAAAGGVEGHCVCLDRQVCVQSDALGYGVGSVIPSRAVGLVPTAAEDVARYCGVVGTRREGAGGQHLLGVLHTAD